MRAGVRAAAAVGQTLLAAGASALDTVVAAIRVLEDDPEFNAGLGSALTRDCTVETDASIMDGVTQRVGAVAAVPDLANPIVLARLVLESSEHVSSRFGRRNGGATAALGRYTSPSSSSRRSPAKRSPSLRAPKVD